MSSLTTNLKLVKPELQDNITPTIFADNFDKIDAALDGVSGGALSLEEIEASTNLDGKIPSAAALKEVNNSLGGFSNTTPILNLERDVTGNGSYDYTVSEDGLYSIINIVSAKNSTSHETNSILRINDVTIQMAKFSGYYSVSSTSAVIPLKAGDVIRYGYGISTGTDMQRVLLYKLF